MSFGNDLRREIQTPVGYRADVDGLRAVAVVPVVFFHAGFPSFAGGYIGVDVFFVISGFLITSIIARELESGTFSLLEFYRRRVLRIFPALALVSITSLLAGYFFLTPAEYAALGKSAVSIAIFCSNFFFWKSVSYWSPGVQPLLHTWSLAVEEQYYMIFPLVLLVCHDRRKSIIPVLWFIFTVSLAVSTVLVFLKPQMAFYLLPSRAWELMLGALLALNVFGEPVSARIAKFASIIGLGLIFGPVFLYTPSTPFPGPAALPPVIGTILVIWGKGWGLSSKPLVFIGLISYSLYLWHLPVIEFVKYLTDSQLSPGAGLLAALVSAVLATLTYRFVEAPFRRGARRAQKTLIAAAMMPAMAVFAAVVFMSGGLPLRMSPLQARQLAVMGDEARHPSQCMTLNEKWIDPGKPCEFGHSPDILLWGDSHAMVTATSLIAAGVPFFFAADADCPIGLELSVSANFERSLSSLLSYQKCGEYNRRMLERALRPDIKTVVLSSRWTNWRIGEPANPVESSVDLRLVDREGTSTGPYDNRIKFERAFTALVIKLTGAGKHVVIVGPVPEPEYNVPHRVYIEGFGFTSKVMSGADYDVRHRTILAFFDGFKSLPNVSFVWPKEMLCQKLCPVTHANLPVYFDHNHLTVDQARRLAPLYQRLNLSPDTSDAKSTSRQFRIQSNP